MITYRFLPQAKQPLIVLFLINNKIYKVSLIIKYNRKKINSYLHRLKILSQISFLNKVRNVKKIKMFFQIIHAMINIPKKKRYVLIKLKRILSWCLLR